VQLLSFGLSKSAISEDFIAASSKALEEFQCRDLSGEPYVSLFLDGETFANVLIILAMGVTKQGSKHIVGMTQASAESGVVIERMLIDLMDRGFTYEEGLLCVSEDSRGISAAIRNVFQGTAAHKRCRLHKVRNVVEHEEEKHRHETQHENVRKPTT
jgi:transposase-like protein